MEPGWQKEKGCFLRILSHLFNRNKAFFFNLAALFLREGDFQLAVVEACTDILLTDCISDIKASCTGTAVALLTDDVSFVILLFVGTVFCGCNVEVSIL